MTDAGRAPLAAVFVSLVAMLLPLLTGATPPASTADAPVAKSHGPPPRPAGTEAASDAPKVPAETSKPEPCDRERCAAKGNTVYRGDASCEAAFVQFMSETEHALPPPDPADQCITLPGDPPRRLVTTLPDPLDTGMRATFDQGLEGVFAALEAVGLLRDRFWSPWHDADLADKEGPSALARCVQRVPAVFTFRRCATGKSCELVELFVVGESATSGVAHGAAVTALALSASRGEPVSVIGPTFSGTAASLREAMDAVPGGPRGPPRFRATTGTASLREVQRLLSDGDRISFSARVLSSEVIRQGFFRYLRQAMPDATPVHENGNGTYRWLEHVALFTESGTSFGAGVQRRDDPRAGEPANATDDVPMNASVVVHFPLHVGMIRASLSEQQGSDSSQAQSIGGIPLRQVELHPGRDSAARRDTPSPLSNQTSTAEDLVLAEQVRVLEEEDIRVIGIFASDPVDALFLVRRLRERLPSAHLFVFEHDALFGHPDNAEALRGVMLVSTYPSTARADRWMFPYKESSRRLLTSPAATGLYNAMLFGSGIVPSSGTPLEELSLAYAPPFEAPRAGERMLPAIWISAVGAGGIVPVATVAAKEDGHAASMKRTNAPAEGRHGVIELDEDNVFASSGWRVWGALFDLVFGLFAIGAYLGVSDKQLPIAMRWFAVFRRPRANPSLVWRWRLGATLAILAYWLATICLCSLSVPPLEAALWKGRAAIAPHVGCLSFIHVAMQASILALGAWSLVIVHSEEGRPRRVALALPAIPVLLAIYVQGAFFADPRNAFLPTLPLAYLRWTSLGSQLSPVIAIVSIFALLIVGVANYLMEVDGGAKYKADEVVRVFGFEELELGPGDPHVLQARRLSKMQRLIIACVSLRTYPFVTGVIVSLWGIFVVIDPAEGRFATIEHRVITTAIGLSFLLALVTTAGGMSAMLTMATALTVLLKRIHAHPLGGRVAAFGASLDFQLRLPFAALPEASGQVACWLDRARQLATKLPAEDEWRAKVCGPAVERILAARCPNDVVGSIRAALGDEKPIPEALSRSLREAWAKRTRDDTLAEPEVLALELAAVNVLLFVFWCLRRLRTVAAVSITCSLLFVVGVASYPFEPARELSTVAAVFVATALLTSLATFVLLERDPLLSELTGRSPGKIDWNWPFIQQIITWVLLPLLAFLATKYPQEVRSLLGWATPFVHSK